MTPRRKTLFISDLHLQASQPEITRQFLALLNRCDASVDALYILGDLFEAWIGDDDDTPFHREIIDALRSATAHGLPIYFLPGNRDFLIGKKFLRETGCRVLADETKIRLYDTHALLMHGDTLCTRDTAYLRWRKLSHNPVLHTLFFLILPLRLRRHIANKMRVKSEHYTKNTLPEIMDVTQAEVERVMVKHGVTVLIHGHTHRPGMHSFTINGTPATRLVLGAWHHQGSVLVWDEAGRNELKAIEFNRNIVL
ncbi:UDP-2,3-diacylglucosamine diphosphatase [Aquicella lusitana]|uniref:UDP-2,3-diacylglucosamine hydrolase n=1 Tax=Aquicella lusitana TaxID=254246 RepID=A0A370GQT2_9COXI|nr:UDP-2,3-diacylglucosamine diphosphatase [Aquicella lusitana]RDI46078.1 UDP-2,3-diacylglucosamine hydrolase [Aquicella lusitana]VVC73325.1 UDP-2,3-diacylglucosamine hydrolase [Aquicella lusitana]